MADRLNNPFYKVLIKLFTSLIPSRSMRRSVRQGLRYLTFQEFIKLFFMKKEKNNNPKYNLSILACLKDEADYILEWLEYYKLMGVEHFFLYDNESSDNIKALLQTYIDKGIVTYVYFEGKGQQLQMYNDGLAKFGADTKWLMVVDIDEFVQPINTPTIAQYIEEHNKYSQLLVPWVFFGDSGHKTKPQGLVIENFINRAVDAHHQNKCIIKPEDAHTFLNPHEALSFKKMLKVNPNELRCNHYYGKSEEEYIKVKQARGCVLDAATYLLDAFHERNKNDVFDDSMLQYVDKIKEAIAEHSI